MQCRRMASAVLENNACSAGELHGSAAEWLVQSWRMSHALLGNGMCNAGEWRVKCWRIAHAVLENGDCTAG